ncbi:MAG: trypsin-like peptidase domain-containing protein [Spirochaetes bacterium]|nr:trypsin-like peptidase domain-containing protein [Spirochaetota bacterium]
MARIILTRSSLISLALIAFAAASPTSREDFNTHFIRAAKKVQNSVVSISIYERRGKRNTVYNKITYGSGTVIQGGYIVTNYHVVMKGDLCHVQCGEGSTVELERFENGDYYLADPKTDIALLRIRKPESYHIVPVEFDDSSRISVGEWVIAVGNPYGLKRTITSGIVSSKGRDNIGFADIEDFIQTDVSINPGNSGGPLINLRGGLVGINTAIRSDSGAFQGISFAIPSNQVRQVCRELLRHGRVRRGWIGFLVKERRQGLGEGTKRLEIISVIRNSPAEAAGLRIGDIIRKVDGESVGSLGALIRAVGNKPVDTKIDIVISREGRPVRARLILRERTVYRRIQNAMERIFMHYGIELDENSEGGEVVISHVSPGSVMYNLQRGDILVGLNGKNIASLEEFVRTCERSGYRIESVTVTRDRRSIRIDIPERGMRYESR